MKKSREIKSGDLAVHAIGPPLPVQCYWSFLYKCFKRVTTILCRGHQFCPWPLIFNLDGSPWYLATKVRRDLDTRLLLRWTWSEGPIVSSERSPDLIPVGVFMGSFVNLYVFYLQIQSLFHLKEMVGEAIAAASTKTLEIVWKIYIQELIK